MATSRCRTRHCSDGIVLESNFIRTGEAVFSDNPYIGTHPELIPKRMLTTSSVCQVTDARLHFITRLWLPAMTQESSHIAIPLANSLVTPPEVPFTSGPVQILCGISISSGIRTSICSHSLAVALWTTECYTNLCWVLTWYLHMQQARRLTKISNRGGRKRMNMTLEMQYSKYRAMPALIECLFHHDLMAKLLTQGRCQHGTT